MNQIKPRLFLASRAGYKSRRKPTKCDATGDNIEGVERSLVKEGFLLAFDHCKNPMQKQVFILDTDKKYQVKEIVVYLCLHCEKNPHVRLEKHFILKNGEPFNRDFYVRKFVIEELAEIAGVSIEEMTEAVDNNRLDLYFRQKFKETHPEKPDICYGKTTEKETENGIVYEHRSYYVGSGKRDSRQAFQTKNLELINV